MGRAPPSLICLHAVVLVAYPLFCLLDLEFQLGNRMRDEHSNTHRPTHVEGSGFLSSRKQQLIEVRLEEIHTCWDAGQLNRELVWKSNAVNQRGRLHWGLAVVGDHRLIPPPFAILKGSAQKHSSKPLGGSFPNGTSGKEPSASAEDIKDLGLTPGSERSPGGGYGSPLQYSCLENPHGQRSLESYSPWGPKELDTTEAT